MHRWSCHKNCLNQNKHENKHLQNSWNKYGSENFQFEIIEKCSIADLDNRERFWIAYYNSLENGYNLCEGGIGCRGYKHTPEEIEKMRQIQHPKKVCQLDSKLKVLRVWESASQAAKEMHLYSLAIKNCCERKLHVKSVGGYIWIYEEDYGKSDMSYYQIKNIALPKKVGQFSEKMELIKIWDSAYEVEKVLSISSGEISTVCNHKRKSSHGYIWAYVNENGIPTDDYDYQKIKIKKIMAIEQYSLDGELIKVYKSIRQAALGTGTGRTAISNCCEGKTKSANNYIWRYKEN